MTASRETASHQSWLSTTFRLKMLLLAAWDDEEHAIAGYLRKAKFTYTIKTYNLYFFSGSIKKAYI